MPISYSPGIQDQRAQYTSQMFQNLTSEIQQFAQQQQQKKLEARAQQYQITKNQAMLDAISQTRDSQNNPYMTPDEMLKIHEAKTPEKQAALLEGALGTVAFKIAQDKQKQQNQTFTPRMGVIPQPPGSTVGPTTYFQGGPNSAGIVTPPKPQQPLQLTQLPVPGGGTPVTVLHGGDVKTQVITNPNGTPKLQLTPEELATGQALGYKPLRQSNGSFVWEKDPAAQLATNTDAVKNFDAHIGKTYGVKSADIFNLNLTEPNAIKYEDAKGKALSTEEAVKANYGAIAVVPISGEFSTKSKRIPLPEWNTILNQWKQLPRAGVPGAGGVSVQGGGGTAPAVTRVQVKDAQGKIFTVPSDQLQDALAQGYKPVSGNGP